MRAADSADRPFLVTDDGEIGYGEFNERVDAVARGFASLGVGAGDHVALFLTNCTEYVESWFALAKLAAVAVPVNTAFAAPEARYLLEHSGASTLVADAALYERSVAPVRAELPDLRTVVGVGETADVRFEELARSEAPPAPRPPVDDTAGPFTILYTSGTTGYPKGCVLPQSYFVFNGAAICDGMALGPDDRILMPLPLFHVNAEITIVGIMVNRAAYILRPRFSATRFLDEARHFRATAFNHVGTMITLLAKQPTSPRDRDHELRVACGGGAPAGLVETFAKRFGITLVELYATTESCMDTMGSYRSVGQPQPFGSAGAPVWFKDVEIHGRDDAPLPAGEAGEIATRPKLPGTTMLGYFRDEEATVRAVRGGWFHSGDIGRLDERGFLTFVDRARHVIRRSGEQISSLEVERVLKEHPAVLEVAVVPVPDEIRGEEVKACVVVRPEARSSFVPAELFGFCEGRLATFKIPRFVKVYDSLPTTETQRIKKYELQQEPEPLAGAVDRLHREEER